MNKEMNKEINKKINKWKNEIFISGTCKNNLYMIIFILRI